MAGALERARSRPPRGGRRRRPRRSYGQASVHDLTASTSSPGRGSPPRPSSAPRRSRASRAPSATSPSPAGAFDARGRALHGAGVDRVQGHGWPSAALTPYRLTAGRAPSGPRDVVADARLGARVGASLRIVDAGRRGDLPRLRPRVGAREPGPRPGRAVLHGRASRAAQSGAPGHVNAIGVVAAAGRLRRPRCARGCSDGSGPPASRCSTATTRRTPTPATRPRPTAPPSSRSSGRWAGSRAPSRCSSWRARSRSRSPSAAARRPCCAPSGRRRARSGA